jgi:hypothetical protein
MREVKDLKDYGKEKVIMIIGGGPSVKLLNWMHAGFDDVMVINDTIDIQDKVKIDFNIYKDLSYAKRMNERILKKIIPSDMVTIGHWSHALPITHYGYDHNQIGGTDFIHTGAYAVCIADRIMNYDNIYLIGFDYNTDDNGNIHYYSKGNAKSDYYNNETEAHMIKRAFLKNAVRDYDKYKYWSYDKIYNLNPNSKLKKFRFKEL